MKWIDVRACYAAATRHDKIRGTISVDVRKLPALHAHNATADWYLVGEHVRQVESANRCLGHLLFLGSEGMYMNFNSKAKLHELTPSRVNSFTGRPALAVRVQGLCLM